MKQTSRITIVFLTLIIAFAACKEDKYIDWKLKNELFLESNKTKAGMITTPSGLQYQIIEQGYLRHPKPTSDIYVTYTGALIDGSVFESKTKVAMELAKTLAGWKEGIPKMQTGGKYKFYLPSALGYDTATTIANIPPYSTLIFDVELIGSDY